ncbi:hypothetical protein JXC34_00930 [Candidatus Woesearchaeota archaeon]|nr:hypothetical protein [Candidatus Woesearchaeota archaeon]
MDYQQLAKELEGLHTIGSITAKMGIKKETAVNYVYELNKRGYVELFSRKKKRIYRISPLKKLNIGNPGMYDIINKYSPMKLREPYEHTIYGKELSKEEALVRAINSKDYRVILASLSLFSHMTDWKKLNDLAKQSRVQRFVGALYDLAARFIRVRKMDNRTRNSLLNSELHDTYLISKLRSDDFIDLEKIWGVYLPFNNSDMERIKND